MMQVSLYLIGLMCALPFLQPRHSYPITSFYSEWVAFILGCAALAPLVLGRYYHRLRVPSVALMPAAFALLLIVQALVIRPPYPQELGIALVYLAWAAALNVLAGIVRREVGVERCTVVLAWFFLVSGFLGALAGVLQYYDARGILEPVIASKVGREVYGNLGQPNHFADQITFALASLAMLLSLGRVKLGITVAVSALLLFVLSLSGSRSTWLYLVALAVLALLAYRGNKNDGTRAALRFTVALLPGFALAHGVASLPWLAPPTMHTTVLDRLFELARTQSQRLDLWHEAWLTFLDSPVLGAGWGQFCARNFSYAGTLPGVSLVGLYNNAHNLLFHLLAETGIAGVAIVAAGLIRWTWGARVLLRSSAGWWMWALLSIIGIHSMLEYPLWHTYFLGPAAVLLGLGATHEIELHATRLLRTAIVGIVGGASALSVVMFTQYYRLETVLHTKYRESDVATLARSQREMIALRAGFFLAPYVEVAYARDIALEMNGIDRKIAFMNRVMQFTPTGMVAYRYAALLALDGRYDESARMLRHATAAYPSLLPAFTEEFERSNTGNARAQARFVELLRGQLQSTTGALTDENWH
jgi:O-antigen ligase